MILIFGIELAAAHEHSLAVAEVDGLAVELLQPGVVMALGKPEEQALDLDVAAIDEQRLKPPGAQVASPSISMSA